MSEGEERSKGEKRVKLPMITVGHQGDTVGDINS